MNTGRHHSILMCAVTVTEIQNLKATVAREDPNAFVIVSPAHEILSLGFNLLEKE
jgi:uncharacterized membrane-anchored protein YitT (DUF2179 family)